MNGKLCKKCERWKALEDFPHNHFMNDDRDHRCRVCIAARDRDRVVRAQDWFQAYKAAHECVQCGEANPLVLDCHGRQPGPSVASLVAKGRSLEALQLVAAQTDVLCANCHRLDRARLRISRGSDDL